MGALTKFKSFVFNMGNIYRKVHGKSYTSSFRDARLVLREQTNLARKMLYEIEITCGQHLFLQSNNDFFFFFLTRKWAHDRSSKCT